MTFQYPHIPGTRRRNPSKLVRDIEDLPQALTQQSSPTTGGKNVFAFWNTGIGTLPPYLLRNVLAWCNRLAPLGWNIYVLDTVPGSSLNVSKFIDTSSTEVVPAAFTNGHLSGEWAAQHTSDLIRYPLLLKYGGVYMDVGILLFGDLNKLWTEHIANPSSPIEFAGFTMGNPPAGISIVNFTLICTANNPLVQCAHTILLGLWKDKTDTTGMHRHPLVDHLDLMRVPEDVKVSEEGTNKMAVNDEMMTDYAIQIQAMGSAQRWRDPEDGWDGPKYVHEHCWVMPMMEGAMQFEQLSDWSGARAFELFSQRLPRKREDESEDQKLARQIVEETVAQGWCMKLGHGFSAKLFGGDTLGTFWKKNPESDTVDGTYAGWLGWAEDYLQQEKMVSWLVVSKYEPTKVAAMKAHMV